jgi:hypothetical protein
MGNNITQEMLHALLHYNEATGIFTWRVKGSSRSPAGSTAGTKNTLGYVVFKIAGTLFYAHRLAWLYMTGEWPTKGIDHKNGIRGDNRFSNLREADQSQNSENLPMKRKNSEYPIGVGFQKKLNKFRARITKNQKNYTLGFFDSPEAAHKAYLEAKKVIHTFNPAPRELQS